MDNPFLIQLQAALGDRVTLERELAPGGMSRVFVGRDRGLHRQVVVKVLSPELSEVVSLARFRREIQLLATLQHPLVVPILETGESDGLAWYSMPFVQGQSLRQRIDQAGSAGLPIGETIAILRDVARALAFAHGRGVVHRDVKPANVLLSDGAASLSDFGIARAVSLATETGDSTLTGTGVSLGTPAYMAPEQAAADPSADHRVDLYALGVMAHEMLDGKVPFAGTLVEQFAAKLGTRRPELRRSDVPGALRGLISSCLAPNPIDRPPTAQVVADQLVSLQTGSSAGTVASSRRIKPRTIQLGVGTLLIGGAMVAALVRREDSTRKFSARMIDSLPPLAEAPAASLVSDSARVILFAGTADEAEVAGKIATELVSRRSVNVKVTVESTPARTLGALRTILTSRDARFGIAPWVTTDRGMTTAGALIVDLVEPAGKPGRGECDIRSDAVAGTPKSGAIDSAAADLAGRIHSLFLLSFELNPFVSFFQVNDAGQRVLNCLGTAGRGVPSAALAAYSAAKAALDRGDRFRAREDFAAVLSVDSTSPLAAQARAARAELTSRSLAERIAAVDSGARAKVPSDPVSMAYFQIRRAGVAGDVRAELEAARSLNAIQPNPQVLWGALIGSARPTEAATLIDRELAKMAVLRNAPPERLDSIRQHGTPGELSWASSPVAHEGRTGYLWYQRLQTHWLTEDDSALVASAVAVLSRRAVSPGMRKAVVPYLLHGLLAAGDTAVWRVAFSRFAPDQPLPRAQLMAGSMNFALARGDAALGRLLAEEIIRDFAPYLGQPDVPVALAITIAGAHRALGHLGEARGLLEAAENSPDPDVVRTARRELLLTVARLGDERAVADLTAWVRRDLAAFDPPVALLTLARLHAAQGNLPAAWEQLRAFSARGLTRWHADPRLDPELSKLRDYGPAKGFFTTR